LLEALCAQKTNSDKSVLCQCVAALSVCCIVSNTVCRSVLQCAAVCCNMLRCAAVCCKLCTCCSVLHRVAVGVSVFRTHCCKLIIYHTGTHYFPHPFFFHSRALSLSIRVCILKGCVHVPLGDVWHWKPHYSPNQSIMTLDSPKQRFIHTENSHLSHRLFLTSTSCSHALSFYCALWCVTLETTLFANTHSQLSHWIAVVHHT